jgi:hypothetical protein
MTDSGRKKGVLRTRCIWIILGICVLLVITLFQRNRDHSLFMCDDDAMDKLLDRYWHGDALLATHAPTVSTLTLDRVRTPD